MVLSFLRNSHQLAFPLRIRGNLTHGDMQSEKKYRNDYNTVRGVVVHRAKARVQGEEKIRS